jgi:hypothetical protein
MILAGRNYPRSFDIIECLCSHVIFDGCATKRAIVVSEPIYWLVFGEKVAHVLGNAKRLLFSLGENLPRRHKRERERRQLCSVRTVNFHQILGRRRISSPKIEFGLRALPFSPCAVHWVIGARSVQIRLICFKFNAFLNTSSAYVSIIILWLLFPCSFCFLSIAVYETTHCWLWLIVVRSIVHVSFRFPND